MRRAGRLIGNTVIALLLLCCLSPALAQARRPGIIVILADDLGYGDTGVYGSRIAKTPNIDALAASGIRFTEGYVTNPVCAPSRAGLMTGRYQQRFGYEYNPAGRDETGGMSLHEITIAQILKSAGYVTGAIGKWHLGQPAAYYPTDPGFDYFFGMADGGSDYIIDPAPGDEYIGQQGRDIVIPAAGPSAMPATHSWRVAHLEAEIASWNQTLIRPQWPESKHSTVDFDGQALELFYGSNPR